MRTFTRTTDAPQPTATVTATGYGLRVTLLIDPDPSPATNLGGAYGGIPYDRGAFGAMAARSAGWLTDGVPESALIQGF